MRQRSQRGRKSLRERRCCGDPCGLGGFHFRFTDSGCLQWGMSGEMSRRRGARRWGRRRGDPPAGRCKSGWSDRAGCCCCCCCRPISRIGRDCSCDSSGSSSRRNQSCVSFGGS